MTEEATQEAAIAEAILKKRMRVLKEDTLYTGKYETARGRRLMVKRQVKFIGVFAERYPGDGAIEGVRLNVSRLTRGHYLPDDPRASSIADDARLGLRQEAFYVRCETPVALERFVAWYEQQ